MEPFVHEVAVRFHEVDPAGVVFFSRYFQYAHDAYEAWLRAIGLSLDPPVLRGDYALPLVRAEADFRSPVRLGARLRVELEPLSVGKTSYTMLARICTPEGAAAVVRFVSVCVDPAAWRPHPLPERLRTALLAQMPKGAGG